MDPLGNKQLHSNLKIINNLINRPIPNVQKRSWPIYYHIKSYSINKQCHTFSYFLFNSSHLPLP